MGEYTQPVVYSVITVIGLWVMLKPKQDPNHIKNFDNSHNHNVTAFLKGADLAELVALQNKKESSGKVTTSLKGELVEVNYISSKNGVTLKVDSY